MDDWSQAWFDAIERVANDFEDFCTEIGENLEAIATELQTELTRDLESWLDEWMSQDWLGDESFAVTATFQLDLLDLDFSFDRRSPTPRPPSPNVWPLRPNTNPPASAAATITATSMAATYSSVGCTPTAGQAISVLTGKRPSAEHGDELA